MKEKIVTKLPEQIGNAPFAAQTTVMNGDTGNPVMQTFYVSPDGNDANAGTECAPFATLERARAAVGAINDAMSGDIVVCLKDGVWELENTLSFGQPDSGTNGYYVRYEAAPGASPMISGGVRLANRWTEGENGIWSIPLKRTVKLRALYVNGQRRYMASTKKSVSGQGGVGTYEVTAEMVADPHVDWAWRTGSGFDGILFDQCDLDAALSANDPNVADMEIENQRTWNKNIVGIRAIEDNGSGQWILRLQQPYGAIAQTPGHGCGILAVDESGNHGADYVIHNAFALLNQPGEFFFDRNAQILYYKPMDGEDLSTAEIVVPRLETLVAFKGTPVVSGDLTTAGEKTITGQVKNILFRGVSFAHSDWNLQEVGGSYGKSTVQAATTYIAYGTGADMFRTRDLLPGAIEMEHAHGIRILNGEIKLTGAEGVVLSNDVDDCEVSGNYICQTGGSGVTVGHPQGIFENDALEPENYYYDDSKKRAKKGFDGEGAEHEKWQNGTERVPRHVTVSNNLLRETCRLFPSHCPITSFFTQYLEVSNNIIKDASYSGMSIGWGWGACDGTVEGFDGWGKNNLVNGSWLEGKPSRTCHDNKIVNNRVDTVMTILSDGGSIYTLGGQPGTIISGNYLINSRNHGIYTDEGSADFAAIDRNVCQSMEIHCLFACDYGRKHNLHFTNIYSNTDNVGIENYKDTNITLESFHYIPDSVWPTEASSIIQNSGLTVEYREKYAAVLREIYGTAQDALLPANVKLQTGEALTLNAWLAESDEIWLAPAGTTAFEAGPAMTMAAGNAKEIALPETVGIYALYVKQNDRFSAASKCTVRVERK